MSIVQLGYVGFGVADLESWERFAQDILGLSLASRLDDGTTTLRMDGYVQRILLHPTGEDDIVYAGWLSGDLVGFEAMRDRVDSKGVDITDAKDAELEQRRVARMFWFTDPEGLRHEVSFNPTQHVDPFVPGRAIHGYKADELGLGHIVVRVDEFTTMDQFITQVLGLRLTDYGTGRLGFFRCNRRHHSLAIAPRHAIPGDKRMVHLMLESLHVDDLGTAMDLCAQHGITMPQTLGRHTNDDMLSFYIRTPSGWDIEYGFGGREVDENAWTVTTYSRKDTWGHERRKA